MALRNLSIVMRQKASDLPEDRLRNIEAGLTRAREVHTLPAETFGGSEFWLETRVIIKISTHPCYGNMGCGVFKRGIKN